MTTNVTINAHCSDDIEVVVVVSNSDNDSVDEEIILQNGESAERAVYGDNSILVKEKSK